MRSPRFYSGGKEDDQDRCAKQGSSGTMARVRRFFKISLTGNTHKGTSQPATVSRQNVQLPHSSKQLILTLKQEATNVIGRPLEDLMMGQNQLDALGIPIFLHNLCCHIINCGVDYDALLSDDWCPKHARTVLFDGGVNSGSPVDITEEMFVATSLLRLFLSELPQPLLQEDIMLILMDICRDNIVSEFNNEIDPVVGNQIKCVLVEKLPDHSFRLMEYLSAFLHQLELTKTELCRVPSADLCRVLGRAIAKSNCYDEQNEYASCRVVQIILFNYESIFNDETEAGECHSTIRGGSKSDSDFDIYATEEKDPVGSPVEDESNISSSGEEDFYIPVVSPLRDLGRPFQSSEPRSSREISDPERTTFKKESLRSITDLLSSPGDTSRDEGVRYSSFEYKEYTTQLSGDSSGISDSSSESEATRDVDRCDLEEVTVPPTVCPHEERRSSERFFPGHGQYKEDRKSKNRRKAKQKHSKSSKTTAMPSRQVDEDVSTKQREESYDQTVQDELVTPFTELLMSSEAVTSNRGAEMGAWGWKMSHIDDSHRTAVLYNRSEEEDNLFRDPGDGSSMRSSIDRLPGKQAVKHLTKSISAIKKQIKSYDRMFRKQFGYKPTQSDKMNDKNIRPLVSELNKLRKELKNMKDEIADRMMPKNFDLEESLQDMSSGHPDTVQTLQTVKDMLSVQRKDANRPLQLIDMTTEEIQEEKTALQRALLYYEHVHGRPNTKEDRNLARPLYDRYREIKRTIVRSSSRTKDVELAPILENEAMDFTLASPQHRGSLLEDEDIKEQERLMETIPINIDPHPGVVPGLLQSPRRSGNLEDLHALPSSELKKRKKLAKEEKKVLKKALREYEESFERDNGRKVQKEDRGPMEDTYKEYKHAKAKVKLLEALLTKHQIPTM